LKKNKALDVHKRVELNCIKILRSGKNLQLSNNNNNSVS